MTAAVFAVLLFYASMHRMAGLPWFPIGERWNALVQGMLLIPVLVCGFGFYTGGVRSLFRGAPNMDSLIAVGSLAALGYGVAALFRMKTPTIAMVNGAAAGAEHDSRQAAAPAIVNKM